jgi:hypothetical protein
MSFIGSFRAPSKGGTCLKKFVSGIREMRRQEPRRGPEITASGVAPADWYTCGMELRALPGGDLVQEGLDELARGVESLPALLISIGAPRLRRIGLRLPDAPLPNPEHRLYLKLAAEDSDGAHSR